MNKLNYLGSHLYSKICTLSISGFKVNLLKTENSIIIEAENEQNSTLLVHELLNDSNFETKTINLFASLDSFCEGLQDAASGNFSSLKVNIDTDKKLVFSLFTKIGRNDREITFGLQLEEKNVGTLVSFERSLNKLKEIQSSGSEFENILIRMMYKLLESERKKEEKLAEAINRVQALEKELSKI